MSGTRMSGTRMRVDLTAGGLLRILPIALYAGRSRTIVERSLKAYRHAWLALVSGFFEPLLYLFALGTGLRGLVGTVTGPGGIALSYPAFLAPALLASSAMNGAIFDSTINVFFRLKYNKLYDAILATSLGPLDVALGEITWALLRGGLYSAGFLIIMAALGLTASPWALAIFPAALLISFGFAAAGMAVTTFVRGFQDLDVVQFALLPMFLFSGSFYGLDVYPRWLQIVVEFLPLQHGIALLRALNAGVVSVGLLGHVAYFAVMAGAGVALSARRLERLLLR
jgi:lipooligosaccharide transport system permease protein